MDDEPKNRDKRPASETGQSHRGGIKRQRESPDSDEDSDIVRSPSIRIKLERDLIEPESQNNDAAAVPADGENESIQKDEASREYSQSNEKPGASSEESAECSTKPAPLTNFYEFRDTPKKKVDVVPTNVQLKADLGAPIPKIPMKAHYNAHTEEDEVRYVGEQESKPKKYIPGHKTAGSDSEEEADNLTSMMSEPQDRYFKKKDNVFTKFNFKYRKIDTSRLAVYGAKERILNAIENHRVVIVEGFTGCGKTTQVPQFIVDKCCENNTMCNVVVTQPRRIAAISVAKRVCQERGWDMGSVVGYQVGMDSKKDKDTTLITYMTTGVLLQNLISSKSFKQFTHIIIDEVHERDLNSDLLLLVIKKILQDDKDGKERHVKLILMSATLNAKKFSKYFPTQTGESDVEESPVVKIPHTFRHRIDEQFLDDVLANNREMLGMLNVNLDVEKASISEDMYTVAVDCIVSLDEIDRKMSKDPRIMRKVNAPIQRRGSVLIFLPGMEEINRLFRSLMAKDKIAVDAEVETNGNYKESDYYKWDIVPLHSTITNEEQQRVFDEPIDFRRKIILSTNIAESSVTVPDIMYVIDFCLTKSLCIDPFTNFTTLRMVWASISQCIQRKGRTGRVCDGKVYRLVPKAFFSNLPQDTQPEMLRANLETVVLQLKKLNLGSPKELLAMALDPPVISGIERAVANLKELGALTITTNRNYYDTCDGDVTFLGQIMTDLPIPQQCSRLIMLGYCFGVMKESIIIAAALSVKNPFSTPFIKNLDAYLSRLNWAKKSCSDLFALYYVYKHWLDKFSENGDCKGSRGSRTQYNERQWARGAFVQLSVLREIKSTVELLEERLKRHNLDANPSKEEYQTNEEGLSKEACLMLKLAIAGAFYPNYFHRKRPDLKTYERDKSREVCGLDLYNTVWFKGFPSGHDGKLYAKYIADYLSYGLNVPSIKFDGQKVLATFDNRGEKIGPISKGVYRAVKCRQLRQIMEFPLSSKDMEHRTLEHWTSKLARRRFTRCPEQIALPGMDAKKLYITVTHVENPGQFWVTYCKHTKDLEEMVQRINEELVHIPIPYSKVVPNALCLAPYLRTYYRAKILMVCPRPVDESLVYFVDYGNTCWVKSSALQDFSPSMVDKQYDTIPCLAVECRLSKIKPATIHGAGWHEKATLEFKQFAEGAPFVYLDIYSVSKSIISGRLMGHNNENNLQKDLNDKLILLGYAETADEATYSEFNNRARARVHLQDNEEKAAHNKEQIGEQLDFDFMEPPQDPDRSYKTILKGPWSPLELDFQSLCQSSNTKQVRIDNNSVNSVVLDTEPTAPISRLLVSAHVGIQDRSGSVVARDTTMMPSVPGLLPLLSMVFSPKIELRVDIRQTRYTGVLCGLGTAPNEPDLPIYPDHDVEIVFDTNINDEDIDSINKIRYMMNLILRNSCDINMAHYQNAVSKELIQLLKHHRQRADEEVWPQEEYVWNRIDENSLKPPNRASFIYEPKDIFVPHNKILLNEENDTNLAWNFAV